MLCPVIRERSEYLKSEGGKKYMFKLFEEDIKKAREEAEEKAKKEAEEKAKIEIEKAKKEAEEKAKKQAEKAKKQGKLEGILETAKNLLQEGFSIDNVAKFTKLKVSQVKALTL